MNITYKQQTINETEDLIKRLKAVKATYDQLNETTIKTLNSFKKPLPSVRSMTRVTY